MKTLAGKFKSYFFAGLVLLAPLFLSIIFIGYLFKLADKFVVDPLFQALPLEMDEEIKIFLTKLLLAALVALFVALIGWATRKFLVKNLFRFGESILKNIPVFNRIYIVLKEITSVFFDDKKGFFKRVVFVEYPRKGLYTLGFVTQDRPWELGKATGRDIVNVFIPHPPNPTAGFLVFVPREDVLEGGITVEEGIKLVISAGGAIPPLKPSAEGSSPER